MLTIWTGQFQRKEADLYLKPEPNFLLNEPFVFQSLPFLSKNVWFIQIIKETKKMKHFDLISNFYFSLNISISYFLVLLAFALVCLVYTSLNIEKERHNHHNLNFNRLIYLFRNIKKINGYSSILIFFGLFIWLTQNFIFSIFKTSQILVSKLNFKFQIL